MKKLFRYFLPYKYWMVVSLLFLLIAKGVEAYIPYFLGTVSQTILNKSALFSEILQAGLFVFLLLLASLCFEAINVVLKTWMGERALLTLRVDIFSHIQRLPVSFFDHNPVGKLMTRTIHDVDQINQMFTESLIPLIGSLFLFLSIVTTLVIIEVRLGLLLLLILPFAFGMTHYFRVNQRRCYDKIRKIVAKMNAFVQESLMGMSTIRSFGLQSQEKKEFETINRSHRIANVKTIHYFALFFAGIDWVQSFSLIAVFAVLVLFSPQGFQGGLFFTFSLYILMLFRPLADLAERYNVLQSALAAFRRIAEIFQEPVEEDTGESVLQDVQDIVFDHVFFAYKEENWILKDVSFSIQRGESVALVGITGAGKTTALKLLLRFYPIQKGQIRINGKPIESYTLASLRRQMSVILQDPEIFSGTIEENLTLFGPKQDLTQAIEISHLEHVLKKSDLHVQQPLLERGKSLSAGERQLVSLARAIQQGGSVFLLDEATANIDAFYEKLIQETLKKVLHQKTALVIAHRLTTIRDVDRIIVMHEGKVVEQGTHQALLQRHGFYEKLYQLQFSSGE